MRFSGKLARPCWMLLSSVLLAIFALLLCKTVPICTAAEGHISDETCELESTSTWDGEVSRVTLTTQPPRVTPPAPSLAGDRRRSLPWLSFFEPATLARSRRLASAPNIFGDLYLPIGAVAIGDPLSANVRTVFDEIPASLSGHVKIAENNKALPTDRVYFNYNHYHNALQSGVAGVPLLDHSVNQYTFGTEKNYGGGLGSVELRLPFYSPTEFATGGFGPVGDVVGGSVGNLSVIIKHLLYATDSSSVAAGLGVNLPTAEDVRHQAAGIEISNDAVHLLPYLGVLTAPDDVLFAQAFLQLDVATHGNRITSIGGPLGRMNDQTLLAADVSLGAWLHRDPAALRLKGIAAVFEAHYTTTLQDTDVARLGFAGIDLFRVWNPANRQDVLNLTAGLHTEIGKTTIRVGAAAPVRVDFDRAFDAELMVSINRYF